MNKPNLHTSTIKTQPARIQRKFFDKKSCKVYGSISEIPNKKELNNETLPIFLKIGYVPGDKTLFKGIQCLPSGSEIEIKDNYWRVRKQFCYKELLNRELYSNVPENELIRNGKNILIKAIEKLYKRESKIIVPLSGGLDSRVILAGLLEITNSKNIITYTFGTPKTFDYGIAKQVANKAGVKHYAFDLTKLQFTQEGLKEIAIQSDGNTDIFQPFVLTYVYKHFGSQLEYWSGYLGDPVAGSHIPQSRNKNLEIAKERFLSKESMHLKIVGNDDINNYKKFISSGNQYSIAFTVDEQVDFANRQERFVTHHIFMKDFKYITPFLDNDWLSFMVSLPLKYRINQYLYKKILLSLSASLFDLPTKNFGYLRSGFTFKHIHWHIRKNLGKGLHLIFPKYFDNPMINYIDFNEALRKRKDLKEIVFYNLQDLKRRNIIDSKIIDTLWNIHQSCKNNYGYSLTLLASLEIILKSFLEKE